MTMKPEPSPASVLWISCVGEKGGAEVYLLNFLRHLDRKRFRPAVALLRPGPFEAELRASGIETFVFPRHRMRQGFAVARAILGLRRLATRRRFHLVHSNAFRGHAYGGVAARLAGVPAVWSVHTAEHPGLSTRAIVRIPVRQVIANCPRTADWFAGHRLPVSLIWPPVETERLTAQTPWEDLRARLGLPAGGRWIGMAARLQRYKGQEHLIRALARLPSDLASTRALVIGGSLFGMETDYLEDLRRLAAELGVADRVHFTGFVSDADLYGLIQACEVMVHPALDEDFGLIVAESQALGKPVVAFASVGPSAIVEPGRTGDLVPVGDTTALAESLSAMLRRSPAERAEMGRAGRGRVERLFAAPTATRRLEAVYDACLKGTSLDLDNARQPRVGVTGPVP